MFEHISAAAIEWAQRVADESVLYSVQGSTKEHATRINQPLNKNPFPTKTQTTLSDSVYLAYYVYLIRVFLVSKNDYVIVELILEFVLRINNNFKPHMSFER